MKNKNIEKIERVLKERNWINKNSVITYIKKDCMITETFTGKTYSYRVLNYVTGKEKHLFHKRKPMTMEQYEEIESKLLCFDDYAVTYPETEIDLIKYIFEVVFKLYGYSLREEQVDLSVQMYQSMIDGNISLSDVPVGLGKTHAYLVAAIVWRLGKEDYELDCSPVIITTSSIELQRSIVKDYLPDISRMLLTFGVIRRPISSVIRKGKDNYLCDERLRNYVKNLDPMKKKSDELVLLRKIEGLDEIDLDEIKGITAYDRKRICVNYNSCQVCLKKNICRYQHFMKKAKKPTINFQVCNHNYYLADVIRRRKSFSPLLPDHVVVIIDEAHKLIDAARQMYGSSVSQREIYSLAKNAIPKKVRTNESRVLKQTGEELIKYSNLFFNELIQNIPKNIDKDEAEKFETVLSSIGRVYLSRMIASIEELSSLCDRENKKYLSDLNRCAIDLKVFQNWGIIYWLENPFLKGQCVFASVPIALSKDLGVDLWQNTDSKILTSGTLAVNNDFRYLKSEIGLKAANQSRIMELSKKSPFNFRENCLVHIPEKLPYPSYFDENYLTKIASKVEELIKASHGHTMVLFTSYKPLMIVYEKVKQRLSEYEIILMSRGKKNSIDEFKKTKNGVIFATGSAWEGINIPGDLLSHLIIVKLPFPIPDPISEYERSMYGTMEDYIEAVVVPKMLIKLRQGVGRLIRKETDSGVISILDARASRNGKYHDAVIHSLPECRIAGTCQEIIKFFEMNKSSDFFGKVG